MRRKTASVLWKNEDRLIRHMFLASFGTFFLSMLTTSLGSLVDGLVIGNTMTTDCVAAFGLINPLNFVFAFIGSVLNSGSSNACARALGKNHPDEAGAIFSVTCIAGTGFSLIVMAAILLFSGPLLILMGAQRGTPLFAQARDYLIAYVFGLPAITGTKLLSSVMQLDGDRARVVVSTAVMTAVNIIGDLLCVFVFRSGLSSIAAVTAVSYYAGLAVLLLHFRKKNIIFRLSPRRMEWKILRGVVLKGLPKGVSRITSSIRGLYINCAAAGIVDFCVGRGLDRKAAARLGLAAEEIAHNIIQYGFADGKEHYIDLRAQYRESDGMVLIVRDNCRLFNPKERYQYLAESDKMTNFGLRIVMNLARDVQYTSAMKLNNLSIRI